MPFTAPCHALPLRRCVVPTAAPRLWATQRQPQQTCALHATAHTHTAQPHHSDSNGHTHSSSSSSSYSGGSSSSGSNHSRNGSSSSSGRQALGTAQVLQHCAALGIEATLTADQPPLSDPRAIKSLLFLAGKQPVLLVLPAAARADPRKAAAALGAVRRRIVLAPPQVAEELTGYAIGSIPPLGHRTQLRTVVDAAVALREVVCGGSGAEGRCLQLRVADLLQHTAATVADIVLRDEAPAGPAEVAVAAMTGSAQHTSSSALLRQPKPAGILQPAGGPALQPGAQAVPHSSAAAAGARAAAQSANDAPQFVAAGAAGITAGEPHDRDPAAPAGGLVAAAAVAAGAGLPLPWAAGSEEVELVVVVAQRRRMAKLLLFATVVPPTVPPLPSSGQAQWVRRAWRHPESGVPCEVQLIIGQTLRTALGPKAAQQRMDDVHKGSHLRVVGRVQPHPAAPGKGAGAGAGQGAWERPPVLDVVCHRVELLPAVQYHPHANSPSSSSIGRSRREQRKLAKGSPAATYAAAAPPQQQPAGVDSSVPPADDAAPADSDRYLQLQLPLERVTLVDTLDALLAARPLLLPSEPAPRGAPPHAVAIDAEWQPYGRGEEATPVALLQLATREHVFLLDLLALCNAASPLMPAEEPEGGAPRVLSAGEVAVAALLGDIMACPHVVKVGFQLSGDLVRVADSYPWLPCFRPPPMPRHQRPPLPDAPSPATPSSAAPAGHPPAVEPAEAYPCPATDRHAAGGGSGSGSGGGQGSYRAPWGQRHRANAVVELLPLAAHCAKPLRKLRRCSLSRLVGLVLGRPLDKAQQCSPWHVRPLTEAQVQYAAVDAHCLLLVHDRLRDLAAQQGLQLAPDAGGRMHGGLRLMPEGRRRDAAAPPAGPQRPELRFPAPAAPGGSPPPAATGQPAQSTAAPGSAAHAPKPAEPWLQQHHGRL